MTPGPIALVGSGEFLPAMEAVDAALPAGRPPKAVFLPTAARLEGPERMDYWVEPAPGQVLAGIDEETALVSTGAGWRVEGARHVWITDPDVARTPHAAGATLGLPGRPTPGRI